MTDHGKFAYYNFSNIKVKMYILILTFLTALLSISQAHAEDPKPFMGINHQPVRDLPDIPGLPVVSGGIQLTSVQHGTPADKAGLLAGDLMIGLSDWLFSMPFDSMVTAFVNHLHGKRPGDELRIKIVRKQIDRTLTVNGMVKDTEAYIENPIQYVESLGDSSELQFSLKKEWVIMDIFLILGVRNELKLPRPLGFDSSILVEGTTSHRALTFPWQRYVAEVIERYNLQDEWDDLRERLRSIEEGDDGYRLPAMAEIHRNPFYLEEYGREMIRTINGISDASLAEVLADPLFAKYLLGERAVYEVVSPVNFPIEGDSSDVADWFQGYIAIFVSDIAVAFYSLSKDERGFFDEYKFGLSDVFAEMIYINEDDNKRRLKRNLKIIEIGRKVDVKELFSAADRIGMFLTELEPIIFTWMAEHPEIKSIDTKWGKIGFGSEGYDRWSNGDYKFIFDPDGNDFYANGTGTANSFDRPISWIVDLAGDDAYQSTSEGAQGSGLPGVGILIDKSGDDTYIGSRWAQGSGYFGVGMLIDESGDDNYHGTEFIQGAGLFGYGVLADREGKDRYNGTIHSQGVGFTRGLGLLIDYAGDDVGYCTGKLPTGYGDAGVFDAWSQGCGMGFRGIASGGIGMVFDGAGVDKWEAGNFSQGGGYYYGFGIFAAGGDNDDTYIGSRYGQGFCAHQAAGLFIEAGGNDYYTTRQSVVTGLAWDECVTIFIDEGGDDYYNGGGGFSHGASAHNSICLFLDAGGTDYFDYASGPARAGGNNYHGGSSFSLFLDQGGEEDTYTSKRVANDIEKCWVEYGVFRDGKGVLKSALEKPVKGK